LIKESIANFEWTKCTDKAIHIKKAMINDYGGTWHCICGIDFYFSIKFLKNHYLFVKTTMDGKTQYFTIWKSPFPPPEGTNGSLSPPAHIPDKSSLMKVNQISPETPDQMKKVAFWLADQTKPHKEHEKTIFLQDNMTKYFGGYWCCITGLTGYWNVSLTYEKLYLNFVMGDQKFIMFKHHDH